MKNLTQAQWKELRLNGKITIGLDVVEWDTVRLDGIHHVVHEYANFVSSAEMVSTGQHLGKGLEAPVNTHIAHAFLLNCRKMADFFGGPSKHSKEDDVFAEHYVSGYTVPLPYSSRWQIPVNKQLAHITYTRGIAPEEITTQGNLDMYNELKNAWKDFRKPGRLSNEFAGTLDQEITDKLQCQGFGALDFAVTAPTL